MTGQLSTLDEPDPLSRSEQETSEVEIVERDEVRDALITLRSDLRNGISWRALLERTVAMLDGVLKEFNIFDWELGDEVKRLGATERNALAIMSALYADIILSDFNFLIRNQPSVSSAFQLEEYTLLNEARHLFRHYRTLMPESPAGNAFGLVYEHTQENGTARGNLKVVSNAGVGRYLLTHLHALLRNDDQAGPHVLLLSGTSWAGGDMVAEARMNRSPVGSSGDLPGALRSMSIASPSYDLQIPITGYLDQPDEERAELRQSIFELLPVPDEDGRPISISGSKPEERRLKLKRMAEYLVGGNGTHTRIEIRWMKNENGWGVEPMRDRRRAIIVVQSYRDAALVANAIRRQIDVGSASGHQVYALVNDEEVRSFTFDLSR